MPENFTKLNTRRTESTRKGSPEPEIAIKNQSSDDDREVLSGLNLELGTLI